MYLAGRFLTSEPLAHRISKRAPVRPSIPSPYTSAASPKVIYVSPRTPFVSVVSRVRKLLALVDQRARGEALLIENKASDRETIRGLAYDEDDSSVAQRAREEVLLKGTGKAVEKVLGLALYFQGQEDLRVRLGTGTVSTVDDIVELEGAEDVMDGKEEVPETQIRRMSMVEVGIRLK